MSRDAFHLHVPRYTQPDAVTCGPTSLFSVYRYYGYEVTLDRVIAETPRNPDGGTLAVYLALEALRHGFHAVLYPYNPRIFDPTWHDLPPKAMSVKLLQRARYTRSLKRRRTLRAYRQFLLHGGQLRFDELTPELLVDIIDRHHPVLTGLSATHLFRSMRERQDDMVDDDLRGEPTGHFVVVSGYAGRGRTFTVCDPYSVIAFSSGGAYTVEAPRLLNSILLGVLTYDAVLLEIWPASHSRRAP